MIDHATIKNLTELRRQVSEARAACANALGALAGAHKAGGIAPATPFLADCASDLETLAGRMRLAAAEADVAQRAL